MFRVICLNVLESCDVNDNDKTLSSTFIENDSTSKVAPQNENDNINSPSTSSNYISGTYHIFLVKNNY